MQAALKGDELDKDYIQQLRADKTKRLEIIEKNKKELSEHDKDGYLRYKIPLLTSASECSSALKLLEAKLKILEAEQEKMEQLPVEREIPEQASSWRCKSHKISRHDFFINYRVATDKDLAEKLALALDNKIKKDRSRVHTFLDKRCLVDGEDWEAGFLHGLGNSAVIVLLISEAAIENIVNADKRQDNVLLEYEGAMQRSESNEAKLIPFLVGKIVGNTLEKFSNFSAARFPNEKHFSPKSNANVQETMYKLFKLQGQHLDPSAYEDKLPYLLSELEERLALGK